MSKLNKRYCLEIEHFFYNTNLNIPPETPYHDSKSQTRLSSFETFPESNIFCNKPTPLYTMHYPHLFITYREERNMHTGRRNPIHLTQDEQNDRFSTQLLSGNLFHTQNKLLSPALNSSSNFANMNLKPI